MLHIYMPHHDEHEHETLFPRALMWSRCQLEAKQSYSLVRLVFRVEKIALYEFAYSYDMMEALW